MHYLTVGQGVRVRAVSVQCFGIEVGVHVKVQVQAKAQSMFSIGHHVMCDGWRFSSTNS
jgi:hypothetical protein